jgi:hypothetical protein
VQSHTQHGHLFPCTRNKIEFLIAIVYLMEKYSMARRYMYDFNNICNTDPRYPLTRGLIPLPLICFDNIILVDKYVFDNAYDLGDGISPARASDNGPGFRRTIEPKIDGEEYPNMVPRCIEMIYCAGYPRQTQIEIPAFAFNDIDELPEYLSLIEWCCVLKSSGTYKSYVNRIKALIKQAVEVICAIHNDGYGTSERINILSGGVPSDVPLPLCLRGIANIRCDCNKTSLPCIKCGAYIYHNDSEDRKQVQVYTWKLYERTLKNEHPGFLQISNFGPECARAVQKLFKPEEISITKEYDITDIFIHGIITLYQ